MQPETERRGRRIAPHCAIRKRRVADRQIEMRRQVRARKVPCDDFCARLQQPDNAGGDRIEFDAGDMAPPRSASGISAGNRPSPFQVRAPVRREAKPL